MYASFFTQNICPSFTWANRPAANSVPVGYEISTPALVSDMGQLFWVSDGNDWHPKGGMQVIYQLPADIVIPAGSTNLRLINIPLPKGFLWNTGPEIRIVFGVDKLASIIETLTINVKIGANGTSADNTICGASLTTTAILQACENIFKRVSPTSVRKIGGGTANSTTALSMSTNISRPSAIALGGNLDTDTIYLGIYATITNTTDQATGLLHEFCVEIKG